MYGPLLIPVILSKLPDELNLILSREFNDKDCWDITPVLNILKKEIKAREKTFINSTDDDEEYENVVSKKFTAQTLFTSSKRENNLSCIFCEKSHKPQSCRIVTNLESRRQILKDKNRCFSCLKSGHFAKNCRSKISCYNCSKNHHAAICSTEQREILTSVATSSNF